MDFLFPTCDCGIQHVAWPQLIGNERQRGLVTNERVVKVDENPFAVIAQTVTRLTCETGTPAFSAISAVARIQRPDSERTSAHGAHSGSLQGNHTIRIAGLGDDEQSGPGRHVVDDEPLFRVERHVCPHQVEPRSVPADIRGTSQHDDPVGVGECLVGMGRKRQTGQQRKAQSRNSSWIAESSQLDP